MVAFATQSKPPKIILPIDGSSDLTPSDYELNGEPKGLRDPKVLKPAAEKLTSASIAQMSRWNDCILNIAYEYGNPYCSVNSDGFLMDDRDSGDRHMYSTDNAIRPLLLDNTSRVVGTLPDIGVSPLTSSPQDVGAAKDGNAILDHVNRVVRRAAHRQQQCWWAQTCGVAVLKQWWNPLAYADIATAVDPQTGDVIKSARMQVGEYAEAVLSIFDMYIDPRARKWHDAAWMAHVFIKPLTYYQERFPKTGPYVGEGTSSYNYQSLEQRISAITNDYNYRKNYGKGQALGIEIWTKPCPALPNGQLATISNGIVLRVEDWPLKSPPAEEGGEWTIDADEFPFVPVEWQFAPDSSWGRPLVTDLRPHQYQISRILSNLDNRSALEKLTLLLQTGAKIEPGKLGDNSTTVNSHMFQEIKTNNIAGVKDYQPQPPNQFNFQLLEHHYRRMEVLSGATSNSGNLPDKLPQLADATLERLQNMDTAKLAVFVASIEAGETSRGKRILSLYRQYGCTLPRIQGLDDNANPGEPGAKVMWFNDFKAGSCRVICTPGSGMPKLPAARQEQVDMWMKNGFFGPPNSSVAFKIWAKLTDDTRINPLMDEAVALIEAAEAQAQANQPNPAQIAQMQGEQQLALLQKQMELKEQEIGQQQAIQTKGEIDRLTVQRQADTSKLQTQHENRLSEIEAQTQADVVREHLTAGLNTPQESNEPKVSIAFKAALTPEALLAQERKMGLPAGSLTDAKSIQIPPKPTNGLGVKKNVNNTKK